MRKIALVFLVIMIVFGCSRKSEHPESSYSRKLRVYCSEAFLSKAVWQDFSYFEARNECEIILEEYSDPGKILGLLQSKKDSLELDVVCSIPSSLIEEFAKLKVFRNIEVDSGKFINEKFYFDKHHNFIPYALSYLCFAFNGDKVQQPPLNLGELQDNIYEDMIVMPDPFETGIGRAMLHFSAAKFGKNGFRYLWKGIQKNFLMYAESYDDSYRRFLAEEGYLMPALITQMRYHSKDNTKKNIRGVILQEGTLRYTETAGIYVNCSQPVLAKKFLEYLLAGEFQRRVWLHKWMYPVNDEIIAEFGLAEDIAMYEKRSNKLEQKKVEKEEELWLKKLDRTLIRDK